MTIYQIISSIAFIVCLASLSFHLFRLIRFGMPKDYSKKTGNLSSAITYSFIGAMNPLKKESAYLHFPTYTAGIFYHIGTFVSVILYFLIFFNASFPNTLQLILICLLGVSGISGIGILLKRFFLKKLKNLSSPDDYISNFLVTAFQLSTLMILIYDTFAPYYFICSAILFLYLPLGKLKHSIYFFAARYHLGFFYGWRGVWPAEKS